MLLIVMSKISEKIAERLITDFEKTLFRAILKDFASNENSPLRISNYAKNIRELSRHFLKNSSPDTHVMNCPWWNNPVDKNRKKKEIFRSERIKYLIFGGLEESFLTDELNFPIKENLQKIIDGMDKLSKFTHVGPDTFNIPKKKHAEIVKGITKNALIFFNLVDSSRVLLAKKFTSFVEDHIISEANNAKFLQYTTYASYFEIKQIQIDFLTINEISDTIISLTTKGTVLLHSNKKLAEENYLQGLCFEASLDVFCKDIKQFNIHQSKVRIFKEDWNANQNYTAQWTTAPEQRKQHEKYLKRSVIHDGYIFDDDTYS